MLPRVRNHYLVLGGFMVFPELKEVGGSGEEQGMLQCEYDPPSG